MRLLDNNPIGNIGVKLIIKAELPELSTLWMSKYSILFQMTARSEIKHVNT